MSLVSVEQASGTLDVARVNAAMDAWRQGDAVLGASFPFVATAHAGLPLSREAQEAAQIGAEIGGGED